MKQIMITSIHNDTVKAWSALSQKKHRDDSDTFLIEGNHGVQEAISSGHCIGVWVNESIDIDFLDTFEGTVYVSPQIVLNKIANVSSQVSMIGMCKKPTKKITSFNRLLICDKIQDPGNFGTIPKRKLMVRLNLEDHSNIVDGIDLDYLGNRLEQNFPNPASKTTEIKSERESKSLLCKII